MDCPNFQRPSGAKSSLTPNHGWCACGSPQQALVRVMPLRSGFFFFWRRTAPAAGRREHVHLGLPAASPLPGAAHPLWSRSEIVGRVRYRWAGNGVPRRILAYLFPSFLVFLGGCAPAQRLDALAAGYGFKREVVTGTHFQHVLYRNHWREAHGKVLHVYLEGDGLPWRTRYAVSGDPTPREPLALRLMGQDPAPSIYLGRPCYNGQAVAPGCSPEMWTSGRYGPEVVASMEAALTHILDISRFSGVVLIGYSGGGTLAMLLARRIEATRAVITVAANLDPARWAKLHGYSPLGESINPADGPPLNSRVRQLHYVGSLDRNVPPDIVRSVGGHQPNSAVIVISGFDHRCCWESVWPSVIGGFQVGRPRAGRSG
jgi:hypothetical protein